MRMFFHYYAQLQWFNVPFSLMAGLAKIFMLPGDDKIHDFIVTFFISILSFGFLLAVYVFEIRYSHYYYFYYNRGLSKLVLLASSFGLNLFVFCMYQIARHF